VIPYIKINITHVCGLGKNSLQQELRGLNSEQQTHHQHPIHAFLTGLVFAVV
jgi:hypothetical protein